MIKEFFPIPRIHRLGSDIFYEPSVFFHSHKLLLVIITTLLNIKWFSPYWACAGFYTLFRACPLPLLLFLYHARCHCCYLSITHARDITLISAHARLLLLSLYRACACSLDAGPFLFSVLVTEHARRAPLSRFLTGHAWRALFPLNRLPLRQCYEIIDRISLANWRFSRFPSPLKAHFPWSFDIHRGTSDFMAGVPEGQGPWCSKFCVGFVSFPLGFSIVKSLSSVFYKPILYL